MTGARQVFLFVIWAKARKFEDEIRETLAQDFKILLETEMRWPYWRFTRKLREFYGFGSRFTWWNKARKCGRGPFKVFLIEDPQPEFKPETDTRGRHLLVDEHVYRDKKSFRLLTRHSNIVHSSVTVEETDEQMKVLFGCGTAEFLSLLSCVPQFLGAGSRRACYEIPGTDLCLKCYRNETEVTNATIAREIRRCRHDEKRNTCCQEYRYYQQLKHRLPDYVFAAFPERLERVYLPARGWCLIESRVHNADGTPCERFSRTYRAADKAMQAKLLKEFWLLVGAFAAYGVRFYDSQNILVQHLADGSFRLRVVDFEPASRTLLSLDSLCPAIRRRKVIRRAKRYLMAHCGVKMRYHGLKSSLRRRWDALIASEGAKLGLMNCRAFLENKLVNDIFYEGIFNKRPCIVKCSSRAPESIVNEHELAKRLHDADSTIVAEPLAVHAGPMAFVIVEKVCGPSLTELRFGDPAVLAGKVDDIAADFLRMAEALGKTGIVHRDMGTTDNYLLGADGHLKLIDFQFAVDRARGCTDPWLRAHPKYHFAVFSCQLIGDRAHWNDLGYLAGHLAFRLPVTRHTQEVAVMLEQESRQADFSLKIGFCSRFVILCYHISLLTQWHFRRAGTKRERSLESRLARFAGGERKIVR